MQAADFSTNSSASFVYQRGQPTPLLLQSGVDRPQNVPSLPGISFSTSHYVDLADSALWRVFLAHTTSVEGEVAYEHDPFLRYLLSEQVTRFSELEDEVRRFADLPENWDTYGAPPPNSKSINNSLIVIRLLKNWGIVPTRIVPSSEGGIGVVFIRSARYADIEFLNNGDVLAATYVGDDEPRVWEVTEFPQAIDSIYRHLNC